MNNQDLGKDKKTLFTEEEAEQWQNSYTHGYGCRSFDINTDCGLLGSTWQRI